MQRNAIETLVGALVLMIAGGFAYFAFSVTNIGGGGYKLSAIFDKVGGLAVGSDVRINGIKVGTVDAVTLDPSSFAADVAFEVTDRIKIPSDTQATIASDGLLGSTFLNLVPGVADDALKPGAQITRTTPPFDLMGAVGRFIFSPSSSGGGSSSGGHQGGAPAQ